MRARSKDGRVSSTAYDVTGHGKNCPSPLAAGFDKLAVMLTVAISRRGFLAVALPIVALFTTVSVARAFDITSLLKNKPDNFKVIYVADLVKLMNDPSSHVNIYDANGPGLRNTAGIIPGAHLLKSDDSYDVAKELPANKNALLVFYCADRH